MKISMSFSKSSLAAYKAISAIYLMVSKIYLYRFMHLNIDQITVYQSLFINKANVNRGSRNGMTCSIILSNLYVQERIQDRGFKFRKGVHFPSFASFFLKFPMKMK